MAKIKEIVATQISDSKGKPSLQVQVKLEDGSTGVAGVPSGASTGTREVIELRDADGIGVESALKAVNQEISEELVGMEASDQAKLDRKMTTMDGTANLSRLGGNSIVGVSMAVCKAAAASSGQPVYRYLNYLLGMGEVSLPHPMFLLMEGGRHGDWATDIQEFMVMANRGVFANLQTEMQALQQISGNLEQKLADNGLSYKVGYEGALVPVGIASNELALQMVKEAVEETGFKLGQQILMGVDAAASEFYRDGVYKLHRRKEKLTAENWLNKIKKWVEKYNLSWIEDPFDESAWPDWTKLQTLLGKKVVLVGDDLVVTRKDLVQKAIKFQAVKGVIIKPNQVGTVTGTLDTVREAKKAGLWVVVSHRGSETKDGFVADLGVGVGAKAGKFGGERQLERMAKYRRLEEIAAELS